MVKIKPLQECERNYEESMQRYPYILCPRCGKRTNTIYKCPHCKVEWNLEEREWRNERGAPLFQELKIRKCY